MEAEVKGSSKELRGQPWIFYDILNIPKIFQEFPLTFPSTYASTLASWPLGPLAPSIPLRGNSGLLARTTSAHTVRRDQRLRPSYAQPTQAREIQQEWLL